MKIVYGKNITFLMSGTWPTTFTKCRISYMVWYEDLPDPIYKSGTVIKRVQCRNPRMDGYNFCKYRKGEFFSDVVTVPLRFHNHHMVMVGSLFTTGWYTVKCRLFDEFDSEILCAELKLHVTTK